MSTGTDSALTDLRAALVFDRPVLSRSSSPGARAFLDILDLRWHREEVDEAPLGRAAMGLHAVFSGQAEAGREHFQTLASSAGDGLESRLTRLLGRALLAWSSERSSDLIEAAARETTDIEDDHLASLYLLKLAGFAFDNGNRDQAAGLVEASLQRVPETRVRLTWRLRSVEGWLHGQVRLAAPPEERDPLADFPWIIETASRSARDALQKIAESVVADPWRQTMHFGATPVDFTTAAVLQAEWAGAIWHLTQLRLQQAAMTLASGGRSTEEWERAVANWVLGGGSRVRDVVAFAEPHLDVGSARRLVDEHLVRGHRLQRRERYVECLLALWDLLDEGLAADILRDFPPAPVDRDRNELLALWTVLAVVVPDLWTDRLLDLLPEQQQSLLPQLTVALVHRLPAAAVHALSERAVESMRDVESSDDVAGLDWFRASVTLLQAPHLGDSDRELLLSGLVRMPPSVQLDLLPDAPELASGHDVSSLMEDALRFVQRDADAARHGRYTMYARSPISSATRLAIAFAEVDPASAIAESVVNLALDPSLMADFRVDALQATYRLALSHRFDPVIAGRSDQPTEFREDPFRPSGDKSFQRALLDCAFFIAAPTMDLISRVLAHARDRDARVRRLSIRALGDDLTHADTSSGADRPLLWNAVVGGLFDPAPSVVDVSLGILAEGSDLPVSLSRVVTDRLETLYVEGGRDIRASVIRTSAEWIRRGDSVPSALEELLRRAVDDRSWLVRDAVSSADQAE